jgi:nucleoside-diphosphate-sugar epimerase
MKILVTGSTGFIGNAVICELLKYGHSIIATSRNKEKASGFSWYDRVEYISYDLNERKKDVLKMFLKPEMIIHTAWDFLDDYFDIRHLKINYENSRSLIGNLILSGMKNISVLGTCFEYGLSEGLVSEKDAPHPLIEYAQAKLQLLDYISSMNEGMELNFKWIRLFYIYSINKSRRSIISMLYTALENNDEYFNMSEGDQLRDYLSIEKTAEYIVKISLQDRINGIINCCSGEPVMIKDLVNNYIEEYYHQTGKRKRIRLNPGYYPYNGYEPKEYWGNNARLLSIMKMY